MRSICVVTSHLHIERTQLVFEHFFDPEILTFIGAANCVSSEELSVRKIHEAKRIKQIREQGGVIVGDRLLTRKFQDTSNLLLSETAIRGVATS